MKYSTYQTDLHILPENEEEKKELLVWAESQNGCTSKTWCFSDVEGQSWYGKRFLEIPFRSDLAPELIKKFNAKKD